MKIYLDTTILIALYLNSHDAHEVCLSLLNSLQEGNTELVTSAHSLAETYVTLVSNVNPKLTPIKANLIIDNGPLLDCTIIEPTLKDYKLALSKADELGIVNANFYDLLHYTIAAEAKADQIWTLNRKDFRRFQGEFETKLVLPGT